MKKLSGTSSTADKPASQTASTVKPQHTPGPWKVMELNGKTFVTANPFPEIKGCIQVAELAKVKKRRQANASLIAAAPELLASLVQMHETLDRTRLTHPHLVNREMMASARAAIAKATLA